MRKSRRTHVVVLAAMLSTMVPAPSVTAAEHADLFAFDASPGSFVGDGQTVSSTTNVFILGTSTTSSIEMVGYGNGEQYTLRFSAPSGETLAVGAYAAPDPVDGPSPDPGIGFMGGGDACSGHGSFVIHELQVDGGGLPTAIAATWSFECEGYSAPIVGRIRIGSTAALPALSVLRASREYPGPFSAGETSEFVTHVVAATGELPVTFGTLSTAGPHPADFVIANDTCSDSTIQPGTSCSFSVAFRPTAPDFREAQLILPQDALGASLSYRLRGTAWVPTTSTGSVEPHWEGEWPSYEYYVRLRLQTDPPISAGTAACFLDGVEVFRRRSYAGGSFSCDGPIAPGAHEYVGNWSGSQHYDASSTGTVAFTFDPNVGVNLSSSVTVANPDEPIDLAASLAPPPGWFYPGGFLRVTDLDTGAVLDSVQIRHDWAGWELGWRAAEARTYRLQALYSGIEGLTLEATDVLTIEVHPFADVQDSPFVQDIAWLYNAGITSGCSQGVPQLYCPNQSVTRAQMASFLSRALALPPAARDFFTDDDDSVHEGDINRIRSAGITFGCAATSFCPDAPVTRAQMASFLVRAFDLPGSSVDTFTDDERSPHEADINSLRAAGVTGGCGGTRFCPTGVVTRGQMAAFLHRALTARN